MNSKLNIIVVIIKVLQKPLSNQFNYVGCQPPACFSPSLDDPQCEGRDLPSCLVFQILSILMVEGKILPIAPRH